MRWDGKSEAFCQSFQDDSNANETSLIQDLQSVPKEDWLGVYTRLSAELDQREANYLPSTTPKKIDLNKATEGIKLVEMKKQILHKQDALRRMPHRKYAS